MRAKRTTRFAAALAVAGLTACSPQGETPDSGEGSAPEASQAEELERTGRVVVSGPEGVRMVSLQTESGVAVGLAGDLLDELTRLSGAVVTVAGPPTQTLQREGVEVVRYELVSIDGEAPVVGVLRGGGGSFRLEGDEPRTLVGVPEELAAQVGARIWVIGPETPEGQRVRSYGVIRPPA
jgi:hypothetical protein